LTGEAVALQAGVPVVDPLRSRRGVAGDVALAQDLDAGGAEVGDLGHRVVEGEQGVHVAGVAVEGDAVPERLLHGLAHARTVTFRSAWKTEGWNSAGM
jgi:hypothetical protein